MAGWNIAEALKFHNEVQTQLEARLAKGSPLNPEVAAFFQGFPDPVTPFIHRHRLDFAQNLLRSSQVACPSRRIPHFTHKIWVTDPENPHEPPEKALHAYIETRRRMSSDWTHFLWTNQLSVGAQVQKQLQAAGFLVTIVDISILSDNGLYSHAEKLLAARKFALAADLFKIMVLDRMGGIYSDFGVTMSPKAAEMFSLADAGFVVCNHGLLFQMQCLALPPKSILAAAFTGIAAMPESFDVAVLRNGLSAAINEVGIFAGPNLTLSAVLFSPAANTWIAPNQGTAMTVFSYGSWFRRDTQRFGGVNLMHSEPTIIQQDMVEAYRSVVKERLIVYGDIGILRLQLELLIKLIPHYEKHPTELCKLFFFRGSDKAMGWHNYSILYNFLLARYVGRRPNVLEIGIGTNNLDVPSSMGVTGVPGASLRAWRDFFLNGEVIGADVDKRILFSEPGISTHYVDQTKPVTIAELLAQLPKLDIVIDDGLHQFYANRNVVELTLPQLNSDGIMIIEDIPNHEKKLWENYLKECKLNAAIVDLPSDKNRQDNRLVFILPPRAASGRTY